MSATIDRTTTVPKRVLMVVALITGQQRYSGRETARLVIEALGT